MSNNPYLLHGDELARTEAARKTGATPKPRAGEHTPTSAELVDSVLSLISENIRVAAALDIEAAIKLRLLAERDLLRERERELVEVLKVASEALRSSRHIMSDSYNYELAVELANKCDAALTKHGR